MFCAELFQNKLIKFVNFADHQWNFEVFEYLEQFAIALEVATLIVRYSTLFDR